MPSLPHPYSSSMNSTLPFPLFLLFHLLFNFGTLGRACLEWACYECDSFKGLGCLSLCLSDCICLSQILCALVAVKPSMLVWVSLLGAAWHSQDFGEENKTPRASGLVNRSGNQETSLKPQWPVLAAWSVPLPPYLFTISCVQYHHDLWKWTDKMFLQRTCVEKLKVKKIKFNRWMLQNVWWSCRCFI